MLQERNGAVSLKGRPYTVLGPQLKPGDKVAEVTLGNKGFDGMGKLLESTRGKMRLINVVPSLGSSVCDTQTRRFNEEAAGLGEDVVVVTVSVDMPHVQAEWCAAKGVERIVMLSDHRDMAFGDAFGTHVKELRVEQRSVFVVDRDDIVRYVEYVPEIAQQPNYEAAVKAVRALL